MMIIIESPLVLGAVLRETRTAQNISAETLAQMVETTPVTLRKLEQGKATEAIQNLFSVLNELGIKMQLELPVGVSIPELKNIKETRRTRVNT
jgi:transcriptional regulator with XRE-family HTH domain